MKTGKKLLIALGAIVAVAAIVAASVFGTVAYMTAASKVSNTFTVGNVTLTLDEGVVDSNGQLVENGGRTDGNSYLLMPGKSYDKDPLLTVAASTESCYLFIVARNDIIDIEVKNDPNKPTMAKQMVANGWGVYKDTSAGSRVWVYCGTSANVNPDTMQAITPVAVCGADRKDTYGDAVKTVTTIKLFEKFHVDPNLGKELEIYGGAEVALNAVGIQTDGFGELNAMASVDEAWAAVVATYPYIQDNTGTTN